MHKNRLLGDVCGGMVEGRAPADRAETLWGQGLQGLQVTSLLGSFDQLGAEWITEMG